MQIFCFLLIEAWIYLYILPGQKSRSSPFMGSFSIWGSHEESCICWPLKRQTEKKKMKLDQKVWFPRKWIFGVVEIWFSSELGWKQNFSAFPLNRELSRCFQGCVTNSWQSVSLCSEHLLPRPGFSALPSVPSQRRTQLAGFNSGGSWGFAEKTEWGWLPSTACQTHSPGNTRSTCGAAWQLSWIPGRFSQPKIFPGKKVGIWELVFSNTEKTAVSLLRGPKLGATRNHKYCSCEKPKVPHEEGLPQFRSCISTRHGVHTMPRGQGDIALPTAVTSIH